MKNFLLSAPFCLLLINLACRGTEVGNGVQPPEPNPTTAGQNEPKKDEQAAGEIASPREFNNEDDFPDRITVACASPLADSILGTFAKEDGIAIFTVSLGQNDERIIALTKTQKTYRTRPDRKASQSYAITPMSISPDLTCSPVSTRTLDNGNIERSVTFSSGSQLKWVLQEGSVIGFSIEFLQNVQKWAKKPD